MLGLSEGRSDAEGTEALQRKRRVLPWVVLGVVVALSLGWAATSLLGRSVVYYRTPTEVVAANVATQATDVRLAGKLVAGSVVTQPGTGTTTFRVTDDKTTVDVVYTGATTTALSTAAQPGTQVVAEGSMGTDGAFHADKLMAKCPSKFSSGTPGASG